MIVGSRRESKERTVKFYRLPVIFPISHERASAGPVLSREARTTDTTYAGDVEYLHLTIDVEHRGEEREIVVRGRTRVDGGDTEP